jgi:hypothetical protein
MLSYARPFGVFIGDDLTLPTECIVLPRTSVTTRRHAPGSYALAIRSLMADMLLNRWGLTPSRWLVTANRVSCTKTPNGISPWGLGIDQQRRSLPIHSTYRSDFKMQAFSQLADETQHRRCRGATLRLSAGDGRCRLVLDQDRRSNSTPIPTASGLYAFRRRAPRHRSSRRSLSPSLPRCD